MGLDMSDKLPLQKVEFFLLGWVKSHKGNKVTFEIGDELVEYFERATVKNGKYAGQRYVGGLVEVGADEQPVPATNVSQATPTSAPVHKSHFPGGLTGLAVRWCADKHFQEWLAFTFREWAAIVEQAPHMTAEGAAKAVLCKLCGIASRKELDSNPTAASVFNHKIRGPYAIVREADGLE